MPKSELHQLGIVLLISILSATILPSAKASYFHDLISPRSFHPAASSHEPVLSAALANQTHEQQSTDTLSANSGWVLDTSNGRPNDLADIQPPIPDIELKRRIRVSEIDEINVQDIEKRVGQCPGRHRSCRDLGMPSLCCPGDAVCSADFKGQVGCCLKGAVCTGLIPGNHPKTTTPDPAQRGGGGGGGRRGGDGGGVNHGGTTVVVLGSGGSKRSKPANIFPAVMCGLWLIS